ncbi:MAG TPA: DUF1801 domain-containing protein [Caulobacteraceae bacterium]|jgi:hypothetical protein
MTQAQADDAERRLAEFLSKFTPEIESRAFAIIAAMRQRLPGAIIPVYDNYNALAVGFGPTDRVSEIVFSIAVFPRWVSLFFMGGAMLNDPKGLLKGAGSQVRHIIIPGPEALDEPGISALMEAALRAAPKSIDPHQPGGVVIKSVSERQRPRRPAH